MLASPEAPTADDKSDHRFPDAALIEQQYPTNAGSRRTSYSLYHHYTHAADVYPEFNWDSHSGIKLSNPVSPTRHSEDMERLNSSNSSAAFHCGAASPSPSLSISDTVKSDGVNSSNGMRGLSLALSHDARTQDKDSQNASNKRQRSPSLSQLDYRCVERCPHSPALTSASATPNSFGNTCGNLSKENDDLSSLPPIATREKRETDVKDALQLASHFHYHNSGSVVGTVDSCGSPPARRSAHGNPHTLPPSSELAPFTVGEYVPHQSQPHPATSISFNPHQSDSQPLFASHSHGYLSALPSPVLTQSNESNQSAHQSSYPASPLLTLSAPNSATFPPLVSSFSPLSPPNDSTSNQSQLVSPSSDAPFSHSSAPHLTGTSYRNDCAAEEMTPYVSTSLSPTGVCATAPSPPSVSATSLWSSVENQPPRRRGKLPSAVTVILKTWLMSHTAHPYPTEEEKKSLCEQTHLTMNQVSNWFINARRRILIPPSSGNSVHEVRQPVRRQTQSQQTRVASSARLAPPCLTIRHLNPQSIPASPPPRLTVYSPVSAASPNLPNAGSFDFRYPLHHQSTHESVYHHGSRSVGSMCCSPSPWHHNTSLVRQPPSSPLHSRQGCQAVSRYSPSPSAYPPYHANNHSTSSTPLPSPHYSYAGSAPYSATQTRLYSPRAHPQTPTLAHSSDINHPSTVAYIPQSCNPPTGQSATPDRAD